MGDVWSQKKKNRKHSGGRVQLHSVLCSSYIFDKGHILQLLPAIPEQFISERNTIDVWSQKKEKQTHAEVKVQLCSVLYDSCIFESGHIRQLLLDSLCQREAPNLYGRRMVTKRRKSKNTWRKGSASFSSVLFLHI